MAITLAFVELFLGPPGHSVSQSCTEQLKKTTNPSMILVGQSARFHMAMPNATDVVHDPATSEHLPLPLHRLHTYVPTSM